MKNGKAKGSGFERLVAKAFSDVFGVEFRRTPMSGGWSHDNPQVAGDLVCMDPTFDFPFCIECKNSEGWKLESLFTDNHKWFDDWWKQLIRECPVGKAGILVFTRNRAPVFAAASDHMHYSCQRIIVPGAWWIYIYEFNLFMDCLRHDESVVKRTI